MQPGLSIGLEGGTLALFAALAAGSFCLDLLAHRADRPISLRSAALWSLFWLAVGLSFALFLFWRFSSEAAELYLAGYLFELALSVDNLFVMMAIFAWFNVKEIYCHRVLYWGVLGAMVFRLVFVAVGASLFALGPVVELVFAAAVAFSGVMMLRGRKREENADFSGHPAVRIVRRILPVYPRMAGRAFFLTRSEAQALLEREEGRGLKLSRTGPVYCTPLFICLAVIETTDILFAFDSVPAVIAISREPLIVYSAMMFAVLGLRSLYFVLEALRGLLVHLEKAVIALLFFIAAGLLSGALKSLTGWGVHVSVEVSLAVIAVILGLGVLASVLFPGRD